VVKLAFLLRPGVLTALRFAPAAAAGAVLALTSATTNLVAIARGASLGFIAASIAAALFFQRSDVRTHGGVVAAMIAVVIAGLTRTGAPYMIAASLFVAVAVACLRAPLVAARLRASGVSADGSTAAATTAAAPALRRSAVITLVVVGGAVAGLLITLLPPASRLAERAAARFGGDYLADDDTIGFAPNIRVGSLNRTLKSDRVIMRVEGQPVEYLRGAVLDRYDRRVWSSTRAESTVDVVTDAPPERTTTRVLLSRAALAARAQDPRWFLAEDACDVRTPSGKMKIDAHGTAHPDPPGNAREIEFARASTGRTCTTMLPSPAPPNGNDVAMAEKIRSELTPIALAWTRDAKTPAEALAALARELSKMEYSLEPRRESNVDPVVEFLTRYRRGHCEYFASAMTLLARAIGIPARVVVGFRVDEVNPFTGASVVRDRNAHSWVEAWTGQRWESFDPTPIAEVRALTRPSRWEHVAEALSFAWDRMVAFFVKLGLLGAGLLSGALAIVLLGVRWIQQRRRRGTARPLASTSRPLPAFESLAAALARTGLPRDPSEPLERYARRVDASGTSFARDAASAITLYAEHRYGGIQDEADVVRTLETVSSRVTTR